MLAPLLALAPTSSAYLMYQPSMSLFSPSQLYHPRAMSLFDSPLPFRDPFRDPFYSPWALSRAADALALRRTSASLLHDMLDKAGCLSCHWHEADDKYEVSIKLPGHFETSELSAEIRDESLMIRGASPTHEATRTLALPFRVKDPVSHIEVVHTSVADGLVKVRLDKSGEASPSPVQVPIAAAAEQPETHVADTDAVAAREEEELDKKFSKPVQAKSQEADKTEDVQASTEDALPAADAGATEKESAAMPA